MVYKPLTNFDLRIAASSNFVKTAAQALPVSDVCSKGKRMHVLLQQKNMKRIAVLIIMIMWAWSLLAQPQMAYQTMKAGEGDSLGLKVEGDQTFIRYRIGSGETVMMVCRKYSTSLASIVSANPGLNPDYVQAGQVIFVPRPYKVAGGTTTASNNNSGSGRYTVQAGETLTGICNQFNVSMSAMLSANPGLNPDLLRVGQTLAIPGATGNLNPPVTSTKSNYDGPTKGHTISSGETLYSIARLYGISFTQLMAANPNVQPDKIYPGQEISIPTGDEETTASVTKQESKKEEKVVKKEEVRKEEVKKEEPVVKKEEPAVKKEEPVVKKEEPVVKKEEPVTKKEEPAVKKEEPVQAKKEEPTPKETEIAKKEEPVKESNEAQETKQSMKPDAAGMEASKETSPVTAGRNDREKSFAQVFAEYSSQTGDAKTEKGVATWIEGGDAFGADSERFYALHNNAPIGSVIKVRNMMNNRVIYAKVIGTLSKEEVNDKVLVKLTSGAAEKLNVLDSRFVSEITYYQVGKDYLR